MKQIARNISFRRKFRVHDRFGVRVPFKDTPVFAGSKEVALKSFFRLKNRFLKHSILKLFYDQFVHEYLTLGHMEPIPPNELDKPDMYYAGYQ